MEPTFQVQGAGSALYATSKETGHVDLFISHSWEAGRWSKFLALCLPLDALQLFPFCSFSRTDIALNSEFLDQLEVLQFGTSAEMLLGHVVRDSEHISCGVWMEWLGSKPIPLSWPCVFADGNVLRGFLLWPRAFGWVLVSDLVGGQDLCASN